MYKKCMLTGALAATLVLSGCAQVQSQWDAFNEWFQPSEAITSVIKPYRPDTHQGNLVTKEMVDQLHLGMTQLQVQFLTAGIISTMSIPVSVIRKRDV